MRDSLSWRLARPDEIPDVGRLVAHSFPGPSRPPAWWESTLREPAWGGGAETLFIGTDNGRPIAACQIHPLRQWIAGRGLPVAGVGTVSISPTHRQRGLGALLVTAALRAARERGDIASALYPFRNTFYRRLGYGGAGEALQYQVPPGVLADSTDRSRVELLDDEPGRREALALYGEWMRTQTGQLERGERLWAELCMQHDCLLAGYRDEHGRVTGYALAMYRVEGSERLLDVEELVWTTDAARRGLYGWLSSLGDQWQQMLVRALPSHRFGDWLNEPRLPRGAVPAWRLWAPAATLMSGTMLRILDVHAVWEGRRIGDTPTIAVQVELTDAQFESNAGTWRFALDAGRVSVERGGAADATLRTDIATLSRLFTAAVPPSSAWRAGLLECDAPALLPVLDSALALPEPWTFDRF